MQKYIPVAAERQEILRNNNYFRYCLCKIMKKKTWYLKVHNKIITFEHGGFKLAPSPIGQTISAHTSHQSKPGNLLSNFQFYFWAISIILTILSSPEKKSHKPTNQAVFLAKNIPTTGWVVAVKQMLCGINWISSRLQNYSFLLKVRSIPSINFTINSCPRYLIKLHDSAQNFDLFLSNHIFSMFSDIKTILLL
jgi:hypothetical protein